MSTAPHWRGILNIDKPSGLSSYDVIRLLKNRLEPRPGRIGHAGTLDPLAAGVLLVLLEEATRISGQLLRLPKEYQARVLLGRATDSDDITGRTVQELPVPQLTAADLQAALDRFIGTIAQVPPLFSALKHEGWPLYRLARAGKAPEPAPRTVVAYELELLDWTPPEALVRAVVSAGFYVRALARDLGAALGTCATLSGLVRTRIGQFERGSAVSPSDIGPDNIAGLLTSIPAALPDLAQIEVSPADARALIQGRPVRLAKPPDYELAFARSPDGRFLALVTVADSSIRTRRVIYAD